MFSEIAEIKSIREQKSKLSEREKELTEPILTDLDMIGMLYRWFQDKLAEVLGVNAQTTISNNRNNLVFSYQLYKYFRQDVDWIYGEMMERIKPEK